MYFKNNFEMHAYAMGLNWGMFAVNEKGVYISPITRELLGYYNQGELTASLVNSIVQSLK